MSRRPARRLAIRTLTGGSSLEWLLASWRMTGAEHRDWLCFLIEDKPVMVAEVSILHLILRNPICGLSGNSGVPSPDSSVFIGSGNCLNVETAGVTARGVSQEITMGSSMHFIQHGDDPAPFLLRPSESIEFHLARAGVVGPRVLACVDDSPQAVQVAAHALAMAASLGLEVSLARVMPMFGDLLSPADPVQWQLRRNRQADRLGRLVQESGLGAPSDCILLYGTPAEELVRWSGEHGVTLLTLARSCDPDGHRLGATAQRLLDNAGISLLLVPPGQAGTEVRYRRIVVPIDGSARAESVLPVALRIARQYDAELILVHVVQSPARADTMHSEEVSRLECELLRQIERYAHSYLAALGNRVRDSSIAVRTIILGPGDPRSLLSKLIADEKAELLVMSAHGQTGMSDVSCGSVADYLITHCSIPSLVVRPNLVCSFDRDIAGLARSSAVPFV